MNLCRIYLLAFVYQLTIIATLARLPHIKCVRTFTKLGCFRSNSKPLDELLISDRDPNINDNDKHRVDWKKYEEYLHSLACRCAAKAQKKGYTMIGLQNYGECWSGNDTEKTYDSDGNSTECIMILRNKAIPCETENEPKECMGLPNVNYMYRLDVDECSKSPCSNGGTCVNMPGGFRCTCSQGFKGDRCDQDEDECVSSPCKNGGTCTNTPGDFTCTCSQGFQGKLCDQDINECKSRPCKNGGSCINTLGHYLCKCIPGYTGVHCEQVVDPCQSNPCQNGASCQRDGNGFKCKCVTGFDGTHCEKDVDECQTSPCRNSGSCVNNMGSFHCLCPPGIQGKLCEQDVDECQQHVCLNGATCFNTVGSFHCRCMSGYGGEYCEKKVCSKDEPYDLGLVVDGSGSVGNNGFTDTKRFLMSLIDKFKVSAGKTHFGIIVYSENPKIIVRFSDQWYHGSIPLKLKLLGTEFPDGVTRTDKALKMAGTELYKAGEDRDQVPNVLVVITDGNTAQGSEPYKGVLKPLKDRDVDVIAVGIGKQVSLDELTEIAMGRKDRVIQAATIQDPRNVNKLSEMIKSIC